MKANENSNMYLVILFFLWMYRTLIEVYRRWKCTSRSKTERRYREQTEHKAKGNRAHLFGDCIVTFLMKCYHENHYTRMLGCLNILEFKEGYIHNDEMPRGLFSLKIGADACLLARKVHDWSAHGKNPTTRNLWILSVGRTNLVSGWRASIVYTFENS